MYKRKPVKYIFTFFENLRYKNQNYYVLLSQIPGLSLIFSFKPSTVKFFILYLFLYINFNSLYIFNSIFFSITHVGKTIGTVMTNTAIKTS